MSRAQSAIHVDVVGGDRRIGTERIPVNASSTVRPTDAASREVVVEDLSSTGFRFRSADRFAVGTRLHLGLAGAGTAQARIVRAAAGLYGCEFAKPLSGDQMRLAFTGTVVLTPEFPAAGTATVLPYVDQRYPGAVRLVVALGGAVMCWTMVVTIGVRAFGWMAA